MDQQAIKMTKLTDVQLKNKINFIKNYCKSYNAADGSVFDSNSNVTTKNVATLMAELNKDYNIQLGRKLICSYLDEDYAKSYLEDLNHHLIYTHDESSPLYPYCAAVTIQPFLNDGLKAFGGESKAPKHLSSFNGGFVNLIFALSSQFAGAVATVEYLTCFDFFARKDYGENYLETNAHIITQELQQVIYALNQPASARGFQCPFWNITIFDKYYFNSLFEYFVYPDNTKPNWESVSKLQKFFMTWFNKEREKALLTFPIVTVALLKNKSDYKDEDYLNFVCRELSEGNSFFIYTSDTVDSLSSCCRLRSSIEDQLNDFSYSLGAGGIMTGSINVITLNMNRFVQDVTKELNGKKDIKQICDALRKVIRRIHIYQLAFRQLFEDLEKAGMLPAYTNHFISLTKQYSTIGINGLLEAAEFLGYKINNNPDYTNFLCTILKVFSEENKEASKKYNIKFNTEFVPAENLGVKFAKWDKEDGYIVNRDCYNSYFFDTEDKNITIFDKIQLYGDAITQYLDGGSALHCNLEGYLSPKNFAKILKVAAEESCSYFCFNVKVTICNNCGYINKHTINYCTKCLSTNIDYATRVIGYLRRVSNFSSAREAEEAKRYYHIN